MTRATKAKPAQAKATEANSQVIGFYDVPTKNGDVCLMNDDPAEDGQSLILRDDQWKEVTSRLRQAEELNQLASNLAKMIVGRIDAGAEQAEIKILNSLLAGGLGVVAGLVASARGPFPE